MIAIAEVTDPSGQIQFTYQYPSIVERKSRIDFIFVPEFCAANYHQTAHFMKMDHQVVSAFFIPPKPKGLGVWRCAKDVLDTCDLAIQELINMAHNSALSSLMTWESLKLQCKEEYSRAMAFRVKQHKKEITAL